MFYSIDIDEIHSKSRGVLLPHQFVTTDIRGNLILLGTGTSVGVPVIGCGCSVCLGGDSRNQRTRTSAIFGLPEGNLLIDTSPELRLQLLRVGVGVVHAVFYTHGHADHIFGLDDLRLFPFMIGGPVPLYCRAEVEDRIKHSFDYAFSNAPETHAGSRPKLEFSRVDAEPMQILGATVTPIPLRHGHKTIVLGVRIGNVAYCTDVSEIEPESLSRLTGLDVLVIGALRYTKHPTHFSIDEALEVVEKVKPKRTIFTHMSHDVDYETACRELPPGVEPGRDALIIPLS